MHSYPHLFHKVVSFGNLVLAYRKARKRKRTKGAVVAFDLAHEDRLLELQRELEGGTYQPGGYHSFYIFEPKKRIISAAPFRDRVVHHAICSAIEPLFERRFIADTYASRKGRGSPSSRRRRRHNCSPGWQSGVPGPPLDLSRRGRRHNRDPGLPSGDRLVPSPAATPRMGGC